MTDSNSADQNNEDVDPSMEVLPQPIITAPTAGTVTRRFNVHAIVPAAVHDKWNLDFFNALNGQQLKRYSGGWGVAFIEFVVPDELPVEVPIYFKIQYQSILYSHWARSHNFKIGSPRPPKPVITNPNFVKTNRPTISGTGISGATVKLLEHNVGTVNFGTPTVRADGKWSVVLAADLRQADPFVMTAHQTLNGVVSDWAIPVSFTVLLKLMITTVTVSADGKPTISGTGGLNGAKLEIWRQNGAILLEEKVGANGNWSIISTTPWSIGNHSIQARQVGKNPAHKGDYSEVKQFAVKPGKPAITQPPNPAAGKQPLTITGVMSGDVTLTMRTDTGSTIAGKFEGSGTTRTFTPTYYWVVGLNANKVRVVQTVNGATSDPSDTRTFTAKPWTLVINQPPSPAQPKQTIQGTQAHPGATLKMLNSANQQIPGTFTLNGSSWTFTPRENWGAGTNKIKAVQTVDSVESAASNVRTFTRPPQKLEILPLSNPVPINQTLVISKVADDPVILEMFSTANKLVPGTFTRYTSSHTFTPTETWTPGVNNVYAVQTVGGVKSDPSDVCTFGVKPPKPVITPPPNPATPKQPLAITGVFSGTVTLKMLTEAGNEVAGSFTGSATTRTFTPTADWIQGTNRVKVVQIVGGVVSEPSDVCAFTTKPLTLLITQPPNPAAPKQPLEITGVFSGSVTLKMLTEAGDEVVGSFTGTATTRTFTPTADWILGTNRVKVVQIVGSVPSEPSDVCEFTTKPSTLLITQPLNPAPPKQPLTITGITSGDAVLKMLDDANNEVTGTFSFLGSSTWLFTPTMDWTPGTNKAKVKVLQTKNEVPSDPSDLCTFTARPGALVITQPFSPAPQNQVISGKMAYQGATLTMLRFNQPTSGVFKQTGNDWTFTPEPVWPIVEISIKAVQTVDGIESLHSDWCTFKVKPPAPAISPLPHPTESRNRLTITGFLNNATLSILTDNGVEVAGRFYGAGTTRTFEPTESWATGLNANKVKVVQTANGVSSDPSATCTFTARPRKLVIPQQPPLEPENQVISGTGAYLGATLQMWIEYRDQVPGTFTQTDDAWTFMPDPALPHGKIRIRAKQTVDDLDSGFGPTSEVKVKPTAPAITQPLPPIWINQSLTITGVACGATLSMYNHEYFVSGDFTGSGTTRLFTPETIWRPAPHINEVKVRQSVNDVISDSSDLCIFTVSTGVKPYAPHFELPLFGDNTSSRPTIRVSGLPGALITVRLEASETLRSDTANAEGILEFIPEVPLAPGPNALEVKQLSGGIESDWSEPHRFTVTVGEMPPPVVEAPTEGSSTARKPTIRGKGETGGLILISHADNLDHPFAEPAGRKNWRWTAEERWAIGSYTVQARQTIGDNPSQWTAQRTFHVVDTLYEIGEAVPTSQTAVAVEENVELMVQVISTENGQGVGGLEVRWSVEGEEFTREATTTDPDGWARFTHTSGVDGDHNVLADITNENQGITTYKLFEITVL